MSVRHSQLGLTQKFFLNIPGVISPQADKELGVSYFSRRPSPQGSTTRPSWPTASSGRQRAWGLDAAVETWHILWSTALNFTSVNSPPLWPTWRTPWRWGAGGIVVDYLKHQNVVAVKFPFVLTSSTLNQIHLRLSIYFPSIAHPHCIHPCTWVKHKTLLLFTFSLFEMSQQCQVDGVGNTGHCGIIKKLK